MFNKMKKLANAARTSQFAGQSAQFSGKVIESQQLVAVAGGYSKHVILPPKKEQ
ncbi:hypothetical protein ACFOEE_17975 [Pseudoalteromonas fenneropenaei]|uniref:Uncharacterized protein n=1 Tax=Pseudoalteromonas fenneropenaei TaxID=1737459 RepID=A0ABV7CPE8_9GAMM